MKSIDQHYSDAIAESYDRDRVDSDRWRLERDIIVPLLRVIPEGSTVLDIAAGTGRWLPIYAEQRLRPILLDSSEDMLAHARTKAANLRLPVTIIVESALANAAFPTSDYAITTNFLNWIPLHSLAAVMMKIRDARIPRAIFMTTYLPADLPPRRANAARAAIRDKNRAVLEGRRDRGIYHLHEEAELRAILHDTGWSISSEHQISQKGGRRNVMFVASIA